MGMRMCRLATLSSTTHFDNLGRHHGLHRYGGSYRWFPCNHRFIHVTYVLCTRLVLFRIRQGARGNTFLDSLFQQATQDTGCRVHIHGHIHLIHAIVHQY